MRRNRLIAAGAVLLLIALALVWRLRRGGASEADDGNVVGSAATNGSAATGARKARAGGPVMLASMSGRVTRSDTDAGIPGAIVSLAPAELMKMFMPSDSPTLIAVTDATGAWAAPKVRPGAYVVSATATGFLPKARTKLTVGAGEQRQGVNIALTAGGTTVRGTVTDVGGGAIPEARVTATKSRMPDLSGKSDLVAITNAEGKYEITLADGEYSLDATHDDYTDDSEHIELEGNPLTVDFQLVPGAVIRGQVVARDSGKPVPGALVRAEGSRGKDGNGVAFADDAGNFTLKGLDSGAVELFALGRGYASNTPTMAAVGIGEQLDGVKVLVDRAYSISGHVVRKGKADQGLPGVTIGAFSIAAKSFGIALEPTPDDGAFEIVGLKPATYIIGAIGESSVPEVGKNVEVVDKDVEGVILELDAGVTITGRVEPPTANVAIGIEPQGTIGIANMFDAVKTILVHGTTDTTGAFTLANVPAGAFNLEANAPAGSAGSIPLIVAQTDQHGLVVKMEPRGSVSGHVVDTNGAPVASVSVDAKRLDDDKAMKISLNERRKGDATTKPDGSFTIVGLEAGKYRVKAVSGREEWFEDLPDGKKSSAPKPPRKNVAEVELVGATAKAGITLTVEARDGVIRGNVIAPDKKPAADSWVTARRVFERPEGMPEVSMGGFGSLPPVLTSADGQFTITKLRKGTYNLTVEGPRGATRAEKLGVKTGDSVTIQLASLGTLTGKVTLAGAPVTKFDIECNNGKDDDAEKSIESKDGTYTLERLAPGKFECKVSGDAGTGKGSIDVPAGEAKLDVTLTRWVTVSGVVVSVLDKKPVAGINVFAGGDAFSKQNLSNMFSNSAPVTDANGRFLVTKVAVGKGKVVVMPKDGFQPLGSKDYSALEGQQVNVGTIEIVPPRQGDAGTYGLSTTVDDKKLVVASVKGGGPAEGAGVQVGDRVVSINGQDVDTLTPMIAETLLQSGNVGVGQPTVLVLDRAGSPVNATMTSVKW